MQANQTRLYQDVEFLTGINPPRNYLNLESLEKVVSYLKSEFEKIGASPTEQKWIAQEREYKNVIASYDPDKPKRLIVGAHYDVCGDQPGADDNASAVAGLLEVARMVFAERPDLDYGIDFVAYCLEEPPFWETDLMGSNIHAKSLYENKVDVIGMMCFEMIGYFSDEENSQQCPIPELEGLCPTIANFIVVVGTEKYQAFNEEVYLNMAEGAGIDVFVISLPTSIDMASWSDHRNYWKYDYPGLMINNTSFYRNPNYHEKTDTIDTLDFEKMTEVVSGSYRAIVGLKVKSEGSTSP